MKDQSRSGLLEEWGRESADLGEVRGNNVWSGGRKKYLRGEGLFGGGRRRSLTNNEGLKREREETKKPHMIQKSLY